MDRLDKESAVPLYEQLKLSLSKKIEEHVLQEGERLPSEAELCAEFDVSRITVRRAVDELVEEGVLERRQGKGTFVASSRMSVQMMPMNEVVQGFYTRDTGRKQTHVISKKEYVANQHEREALALQEGDAVYVFTRQMMVDGNICMLDRSTFPAGRFPGLFDRVTDNMSTYRLLEQEYGVVMYCVHKEISHTYASAEQAKWLDCAVGTPLFRMYKVVRDPQGVPIHMSSSYMKADSVIFVTDNELLKG
ncbi:MAG: GntR family transcriptional regulator [Candidatus Ventricola sp.]|nr:GntR family transcriptional regulator [Candidatus Ventricola sp.]